MAHNRLYMIFALGTFCKIGTACTGTPTLFVLAISLTVGCSMVSTLIVGTDIAVVILIINVLVFLEETLFLSGGVCMVRQFDSLDRSKSFCYTGSFISCIGYQGLYSDPFYLVI